MDPGARMPRVKRIPLGAVCAGWNSGSTPLSFSCGVVGWWVERGADEQGRGREARR